MRYKVVSFLFCFVLVACLALFSNETDRLLQERSTLLTELGKKEFAAGRLEQAVLAFEEAYAVYPSNVLPLIIWGDILCRVGMFERAETVLKKIPIDNLSHQGQVQIFLMFSQIAISSGSLADSAGYLNRALKVFPDHPSVLVRLAAINRITGSNMRAEELMSNFDVHQAPAGKDRAMAFILHLGMNDLAKSFEAAFEYTEKSLKTGEADYSDSIFHNHLIFFFTNFPAGLSNTALGIYFFIIFFGLAALAYQLSPGFGLKADLVFLILGTAHLLGARLFGGNDTLRLLLVEDIHLLGPNWLIPRLINAAHLLSWSLFVIFPTFLILPQSIRPQRKELYAIWFFCWWFMFLVVSYQTRFASNMVRGGLIAAGALFSAICALLMPMGRYFLFIGTKTLGFNEMPALGSSSMQGGMSFTDAKIQEARILKFFEQEKFIDAVTNGRRILDKMDKTALPGLSMVLIRSYIELEDFFEVDKHLKELKHSFKTPRLQDQGGLITAYYRCIRGDFAGAMSWIKGVPEERAARFTSNETAMSLFVIGRCNLAMKELVQAHIDFTSALMSCSDPLLKAKILCELAAMDTKMNRRESVEKWLQKARKIVGGPKSKSLVKVTEAMKEFLIGNISNSLKLCDEACSMFERNATAFYWKGRVLCQTGDKNQAENLLEKMTAGSAEAQQLMEEITGTSGK